MTIELKTVEFRGEQPGPHLLITGGVHGDEFEGPFAIRQLIERFRDPENDTPLGRGRLTLVPVVHEAAFLNGRRTAEDGVDLARICPGKADGTPTEQVAFALSELIRSADAYIDLHSGGTEFSVMPLTGYVLHPDEKILNQQRAMAEAFHLQAIWGTSPHLEGRSLSVARDANVPAIYGEYLGSGLCDSAGVFEYVDGCLNILAYWKLIDDSISTSPAEYFVEDDRPDSGHMQLCNPSPITGLFEAAVELGQEVEAGEVLGTVHDLMGETSQPIAATQTGVVLVLRTFSRVKQGDSVAVILET